MHSGGSLASHNAASARARDIRAPREIYDDERRAAADDSLRAFLESYFAAAFPLAWSDDHIKMIETLERVATEGGMFALAMPRGSGKTTIVVRAALWAVLTGRRKFIGVIASMQAAARRIIKAMRSELSFNEQLRLDYPAEMHGIWQLKGDNRKAAGQLCDGEKTGVSLGVEEIVFPTHRYTPIAGSVIYAAGLTGNVRGPSATRQDGSVIRPDFVILDDPQTREAATSQAQIEERYQIIQGDVMGLAGPGETIAAVMPCTVIAKDDLADRYLENPLWHSLRAKMLPAFPTNLKLWDEYFEERQTGLREDGTTARGDAFYLKHRQPMDDGAVVAWEARKDATCISAVQSAMHLWFRDPAAFAAEYQNEPIESILDANRPTFDRLCNKTTGLDSGVVPVWATRLTAAIDVQQSILFYIVVAWANDFTGSIIGYGGFPKQGRHYYTANDASPTLQQASGQSQLEPALWWGMTGLTNSILGNAWPREGGGEMRVDKCLIDSGWGNSTNIVYEFCRRSPFGGVLMPSKGIGLTGAKASMNEWENRQGDFPSPAKRDGWVSRHAQDRAIRHVLIDSNHWKTFTASRANAADGEPGRLTVFGSKPESHRLLIDHLAAETAAWSRSERNQRWEWTNQPGRDNHLLDCLYMATVAAAMLGVALSNVMPTMENKKRVKFSERQKMRRA